MLPNIVVIIFNQKDLCTETFRLASRNLANVYLFQRYFGWDYYHIANWLIPFADIVEHCRCLQDKANNRKSGSVILKEICVEEIVSIDISMERQQGHAIFNWISHRWILILKTLILTYILAISILLPCSSLLSLSKELVTSTRHTRLVIHPSSLNSSAFHI